MRQRTVTVHAGVLKDEYIELQEQAQADPHARGSLRLYTGSVLREHLLKIRTAAASVSPGMADNPTKERSNVSRTHVRKAHGR